MKKLCFLLIPLLAAVSSCDDSDDGDIGSAVRPNDDNITTAADMFPVATQSVQADSVYADNSAFVIGSYTSKTFGTVEGSLLAQAIHPDRSAFADGSAADGLVLKIHASAHQGGDETTLNIFRLKKLLDYRTKYYSNISAETFADKSAAIGTRKVTADELKMIDEAGAKKASYVIEVPFNQEIADSFVEDLSIFDTENGFLEFFNGFYLQTSGENQIFTVDSLSLSLRLRHGEGENLTRDTLAFPVNNEVRQVNKIEANTAEQIAGKNSGEDYVFSPAGIFTKIELPVRKMIEKRLGDRTKDIKYNSVKMRVTQCGEQDEMPVPGSLLLIKESEMKNFFEQKQKPDNQNSFLARMQTNETTKEAYYSFDLTSHLQSLTDKAAAGQNADETETFLLVPVRLIYSGSALSQVQNNFALTALRLRNGADATTPLAVTMVYSEFFKYEQK